MTSRRPRPVRPRIVPVSQPSERAAPILDATTAMGTETPYNVFTTLAHHDRLLEHYVRFGTVLLLGSGLPPRVREIVILRVAHATDCAYEYGQHVVIGQQAGLTPDECVALAGTADLARFEDEERAVIAMVDELCAEDCVGDETWARLADRWSEHDLIELLMLAGSYRMLAGLLNSTGVALDPGLAGFPD